MFLHQNIYSVGGAETEEEAIQLFKDLKSLLSKGGFELKSANESFIPTALGAEFGLGRPCT